MLINRLITNICRINTNTTVKIPIRKYQTNLKRFYKEAAISQTEDGYAVTLDSRKLKTPAGKILTIPTEPLALMVANEWNSQGDHILRSHMHLTSLCNTAQDNPTHRTKDVVIQGIMEYLATDTLCYHSEFPTELKKQQEEKWDPLLAWVKERYGVELEVTTSLAVPHIPQETHEIFIAHLNSYNKWALTGYQNLVECIKSMILTSALVDRHLTVEEAVESSKLEQLFQVGVGGIYTNDKRAALID